MMKLVERRSASRFNVSLAGIATTDFGYDCVIEIGNISSSGLQFEVAQEDVVKLIPQNISLNTLSPVPVLLSFNIDEQEFDKLTDHSMDKKLVEVDGETPVLIRSVKVQCGVVYIRRKTLDICFVGCRFEEFLDNGADVLTKFLAKIVR